MQQIKKNIKKLVCAILCNESDFQKRLIKEVSVSQKKNKSPEKIAIQFSKCPLHKVNRILKWSEVKN